MNNDLKIYAKGKAFEDGVYDLRALETLIKSYRSILDRLVAVQLGRRQLNEKAKRQLNYDVKIKDGSIELLINFVLDHPEVIGLIAADGGYQLSNLLTKLYRDAINLRKAAAKFIEKGIRFDIKIINSFNLGSNNTNVNTEGNEILITDPKILWAAQTTRYPTDLLLKRVDGKEIEKVEIVSNEEMLVLNENDQEILGRDKEVLNAKLKIIGRLDMIAFTSHKGIIVSEKESFPVTWDENIRSKMQKVADTEGVLFTVQPIIDHSRLHNDAIGFHVLDCVNPQSSMAL